MIIIEATTLQGNSDTATAIEPITTIDNRWKVLEDLDSLTVWSHEHTPALFRAL